MRLVDRTECLLFNGRGSPLRAGTTVTYHPSLDTLDLNQLTLGLVYWLVVLIIDVVILVVNIGNHHHFLSTLAGF